MPAKGRRSSSAAKTDSPKATIKNFFGAKKSEEKKEEAGDSPGKTSDYESEASRSTTPAPSTAESSPKEAAALMVEKEKAKGPSKSGDTKVAAGTKREVKEENDEDAEEEGVDVFSQPADEDDEEGEDKAEDKVKVKAALQTGLLGKGIAEEEERMAGENRR